MEEALGADGYGFLEQHDALIGLVAEELQGGEAAGRRHVEMLPAARRYDKAFCRAHVRALPRPGSICPRTDSTRSSAPACAAATTSPRWSASFGQCRAIRDR